MLPVFQQTLNQARYKPDNTQESLPNPYQNAVWHRILFLLSVTFGDALSTNKHIEGVYVPDYFIGK